MAYSAQKVGRGNDDIPLTRLNTLRSPGIALVRIKQTSLLRGLICWWNPSLCFDLAQYLSSPSTSCLFQHMNHGKKPCMKMLPGEEANEGVAISASFWGNQRWRGSAQPANQAINPFPSVGVFCRLVCVAQRLPLSSASQRKAFNEKPLLTRVPLACRH